MEDELRKLVENRRKRKYLKSDVDVPKRTKKRWDNAGEQAILSQNVVASGGSWEVVASGGSWESTEETNHDKQQGLDGIQSSFLEGPGNADFSLYGHSSTDQQTARNDLCINFMEVQHQFDETGRPPASQKSGAQTRESSDFRSNIYGFFNSTAPKQIESLHEGQQSERGNSQASQGYGHKDRNREFDGSPDSSPPSSSDSEKDSSSASSSVSEEGRANDSDAHEESNCSHNEESDSSSGSSSVSEEGRANDSDAHEESNCSHNEESDSSSGSSSVSEDGRANDSDSYEESSCSDNEDGGHNNNQERNDSNQQETDDHNEQEMPRSEEDEENDRNEEDQGNGRREEEMGNGRNEEDEGDDRNEEDQGNGRREEEMGNGRNEEDEGDDRNEEDQGNGRREEEMGNGANEENAGNGGNNEQIPNQRPHSNLQEWMDSPHHNENITTRVDITQLDLLYMALGLAKQNNDSNKAFNDAIKLLNKMFVSPVLPRSPYLVDKLVMSHAGVSCFFFCEQCFHDFGELDYHSVKEIVCPTCNTVNCISDLRTAHYFCLFDIKCALESLLSNPEIREALLTPNEAIQTTQDGVFTDIYSGSMYKKFVEMFGAAAAHVVSFHLNTDGSPLFSSSKCSIWPISLALNELPLSLRLKNLICAGLWFGKKKPPMDLFLKPFVSHMCELSQGFQIRVGADNWNMRAYVIGVSVDSGARGAVQGLKTHAGYDSCSWCSIHGVYLAGAVRFPLSDTVHRLRCHEDIVRMQYELVDEEHLNSDDDDEEEDEEDENNPYGAGVNAVSPLINLPGLDMVNGFFVESMHCLHLGITKYAILKWIEDYGCEYYIKDYEDEINRRIRSLRPPIDCRRMPRTLDEKARYKARELENMLLFIIVPVLTNILPNRHIQIWLLFSQGVYLLYLTEIYANRINTADALLKKFLVQWQEAYGEASMTFNLHLLYHLAEHVARWGNIFASSAYCFEDFIGMLKNVIRTQQGIPNQVVRSLSWKQALAILKPRVSEKARQFVESSVSRSSTAGLRVGDSVLSGKPKVFLPNDEEQWLCENEGIDINTSEEYREVIHNKCVFAPDRQSNQTNNSLAQLNDKRLVLIRKILFDRARSIIFLFVSLVHNEPLLTVPDIALDKDDHLMRLINHVEPNSMLIRCDELKIVCFRATFEHGDFVAPLPNVFNRN